MTATEKIGVSLIGLLLVSIGGGFFGGVLLLFSTAVWPLSNLSCFICGGFGVAILELIIGAAVKK